MSLKEYIKDHWVILVIEIIVCILEVIMMLCFRLNSALIISLLLVEVVGYFFIFGYDFLRKYHFYKQFMMRLKELEPKYLICELVDEPTFYEGKILYHSLYEINKSMIETMNRLNQQVEDFKDYIEMWVHEVKIPLSHLSLTIHNHQNEITPQLKLQVHKLENQVNLILYYMRSQSSSQDYYIASIQLSKVIKNVIMKNKDYFIYHKVKIDLHDLDIHVNTDGKWLEFIVHQILNNSFQYTNDDAKIEIYASDDTQKTCLYILDNGIGIDESDLPRIFEKSFTGKNGRIHKQSTGMGLYICQKLCQQLSHDISITSKVNEYTCVCITFYKNHFYEVLQNCKVV